MNGRVVTDPNRIEPQPGEAKLELCLGVIGAKLELGTPTWQRSTYSSSVSTWSWERILSPQRRQTISAPAILVSKPSCSTTYCGASWDIAMKPPHPACLLISVTIRIVSICNP